MHFLLLQGYFRQKIAMKSNKEKPVSFFAAYLLLKYPDGLKGLHLATGIPYTQLVKEINDQRELSLEHFVLIALAINPPNVNEMAAEVFGLKNTQRGVDISNSVVDRVEDAGNSNQQQDNLSEFGKFLELHSFSKKALANMAGYAVNTARNLAQSESETTSKLIAIKFYLLCQKLERDFYTWAVRCYPNARLTTEEERKVLADNFYKNHPTAENE